MYSAISRLSLEVTPEGDIWDKKLFAFIKDPLAYIAIVFLMAPFIYAMAAYLVDYDGSKYEVASSASDAIHTLGPLFIGVFLLSNLQAATTLMIVLIFVIITLVSSTVWITNMWSGLLQVLEIKHKLSLIYKSHYT